MTASQIPTGRWPGGGAHTQGQPPAGIHRANLNFCEWGLGAVVLWRRDPPGLPPRWSWLAAPIVDREHSSLQQRDPGPRHGPLTQMQTCTSVSSHTCTHAPSLEDTGQPFRAESKLEVLPEGPPALPRLCDAPKAGQDRASAGDLGMAVTGGHWGCPPGPSHPLAPPQPPRAQPPLKHTGTASARVYLGKRRIE